MKWTALITSASLKVSSDEFERANVYRDMEMDRLVPVSVGIKERLLVESTYVKRIIEECPNSEETIALICVSCYYKYLKLLLLINNTDVPNANFSFCLGRMLLSRLLFCQTFCGR